MFGWISWYALTGAWRSSQKLLTRWSVWGFNLKAQLAGDHETWCSCIYGPGKDMYRLQQKQNWVLPVLLLPKMSLIWSCVTCWERQEKQLGLFSRSAWKVQFHWNYLFHSLQNFCLLGKSKQTNNLQDEVCHHHKREICPEPSSGSLAGVPEVCRNTAFLLPAPCPDAQQLG